MEAQSVAKRLSVSLLDAMKVSAIKSDVLHAVERVLLDTLACGMGATRNEAAKIAIEWAGTISGGKAASMLGTSARSSALGAGFANCTMMRDLDMNDTYYPRDSAHPSDNIGAMLAVGEAESASGDQILRAILIAYEVQMRSCEIAKKSFQRVAGWDHTTFVTVATAAGAGILLKLDAEQLAHAISIAACYPTTGELRVGQISIMKAVSAGLGASRGIEAAYLAKLGATGPAFAFEGKRGVSALMIGEADWDLFSGPVTEWRLPRTNLKRFPAAYIIHSSIHAALTLRKEEKITPADIAEVRVDAFGWLVEDMVDGMGGVSRYEIDSRETADHSLPYCVATALVYGEYNLPQLERKCWETQEVKAMIARTKCFHDKEMDKVFPVDRPGRVTIKLNNGRTVMKHIAYPPGDYRHPFTDDELAAKFHELASSVLPQGKRDAAVKLALNFRGSKVKDLLEACTPG
ncbi:MAG: MmgE/PrpD family protein [Burkholderiales bacterium]